MDKQESLNSVLGILVLYKTPLSRSETFRTLVESARKHGLVADFHIYDNSPEPMLDVPREGPGWRIHYEHDPGNGGVSGAYNRGAIYAKAAQKSWLLLLDQDTIFSDSAIPAYISRLQAVQPEMAVIAPLLRHPDSRKLLSPFGHFGGCGYPLGTLQPGLHSLRRCMIFNSGALVRLAAFDQAGGYDKRLFDFSDHDFFIRLGQLYPDFLVADVQGFHDLSSASNIGDHIVARFETLAASAKIFKGKHNLVWRAGVTLTIFARAAKLSVITKSLEPLLIALRHG